jgi:hypothetical protein
MKCRQIANKNNQRALNRAATVASREKEWGRRNWEGVLGKGLV